MAAAASSAVVAVAANPIAGAAAVLPALTLGTGAILSGTSSSTSFWNNWNTFPILQLSGITGENIWRLILSAFLIYVGIILYTDGDMLLNAIAGSLNLGRSVARNVRRNFVEEVGHNGVWDTVSWVWQSIVNWKVPTVKHPQPVDVALNYYGSSKYAHQKPSSSSRRKVSNSSGWTWRKRKRQKKRKPQQYYQYSPPVYYPPAAAASY